MLGDGLCVPEENVQILKQNLHQEMVVCQMVLIKKFRLTIISRGT